jgi:hypothetical protein
MILEDWNSLFKQGQEQKPGSMVNDATKSKSTVKNRSFPPQEKRPIISYHMTNKQLVLSPFLKVPYYQLIREADLSLLLGNSLQVSQTILLYFLQKPSAFIGFCACQT